MNAVSAACGGAASEDIYWMRRCLSLARQSLYISQPNPRVGCILLRQGQVLAQGFTQMPGGHHAEAQALAEAAAKGVDLNGATAYVTLEPCSHFGRTPPCADALIAAGVSKVVCASLDPNPEVAGQGVARLQAAGIEVVVGVLAAEARALNIGFFSRMQRGRPWLRLKVASSLDGYTALSNGRSQWITGEVARADGWAWRARADAVLTGVGTILTDDPLLNVRGLEVARQPHLLILDTHLRTPPAARCLQAQAGPRRVLLFHGAGAPAAAAQALQAAGAELVALPVADDGGLELAAVLAWLQSHLPLNEVHIEAGAKLNASWLQAGLVDELLHYQAPKLLGGGLPLFAQAEVADLAQAPVWQRLSAEAVGEDWRWQWLSSEGQRFYQSL